MNESTPQTQSIVSGTTSKTELEISLLKSRWWTKLLESGPKIDPATGVKAPVPLRRRSDLKYLHLQIVVFLSTLLNDGDSRLLS